MKQSIKLTDMMSVDEFQPRVELDDDHVDSMVMALEDDMTTFDDKPIHVWRIDRRLFIVDGHHRFEAFKRMKKKIATVEVVVMESERSEGDTDQQHEEKSRTEALRYAITANSHHGSPLKRSRKDNQRAVELLLANPAARQQSDAKIAEIVGVTGPTVAKIRKSNPEYQSDSRITSDGRVLSAEKQSAGAEKRKKSEPATDDIGPAPEPESLVEPEPADDRDFVATSTNFEMTPGQVEERRRKFLDELFDVERLLSPDFDSCREFTRDKRDKLIPITDPFSNDDDDLRWIDDRKLCSAVLDERVGAEVVGLFVEELVRRFLKLANTTSSAVVEVSPAPEPESPVEPEPTDDVKEKRPGNNAFDWSTTDGVRDSMRHAKFTNGVRFREWFQRCKVKEKRNRFTNVPDDATLESWWNDLSA